MSAAIEIKPDFIYPRSSDATRPFLQPALMSSRPCFKLNILSKAMTTQPLLKDANLRYSLISWSSSIPIVLNRRSTNPSRCYFWPTYTMSRNYVWTVRELSAEPSLATTWSICSARPLRFRPQSYEDLRRSTSWHTDAESLDQQLGMIWSWKILKWWTKSSSSVFDQFYAVHFLHP